MVPSLTVPSYCQVELSCSVECSPLCTISWLRNNQIILNGSTITNNNINVTSNNSSNINSNSNNSLNSLNSSTTTYTIVERVKLADYTTNTLSQVSSL